MNKRVSLLVVVFFTLVFAGVAGAASLPAARKPSIVLVHGAFADGSGWHRVIPLLERKGYSVTAVQNPLSSYADDVATTKRVIESLKGPVVVVGHSYGGAVITSAAAGNPNVTALVYVAAFAPDAGEVFGVLNEKYGASALATALVPDAGGYLTIDRSKFRGVFAGDVSPDQASVMAATQKPVNHTVFGQSLPVAAWKTIPSWYMIASEDQVIKPELERFMAKRMGATTVEIKSSHVAFLSHPAEVVRLIESAATER